MVYGNNKIKDIAESVLPSTHRKGAREDLRDIRQKYRRNINRQLARIGSIDDYYDDPRVEDLIFYPNTEIRGVMYERRDGDKLSILRWADRRTVKDGITDPHERYNFVKRVMPDNMIGRHALSHAANIEGFCDGRNGYGGCDDHSTRHYRTCGRAHQWTREQIVDHFTELLSLPGQHQALNATIKRSHNNRGHYNSIPFTFHKDRATGEYVYDKRYTMCPGCSSPRVLAGYHDVEAWVADVFYPYSKEILINSWWRQGFSSYTTEKLRSHEEWKETATRFMPETFTTR